MAIPAAVTSKLVIIFQIFQIFPNGKLIDLAEISIEIQLVVLD